MEECNKINYEYSFELTAVDYIFFPLCLLLLSNISKKAKLIKTFPSMVRNYSGVVTAMMQHNLLSGEIYIFFNRRRNQVKLLHWEGDGFALYYKRLERGTYEIPVSLEKNSARSLHWQQLQFILQGVSLQKIQYRLRYKKIA